MPPPSIIESSDPTAVTAKRFDSRQNPEPATWPVLEIEYDTTTATEDASRTKVKSIY